MNISAEFPWGRKHTFTMGGFELAVLGGFILLGLQMEMVLGAHAFLICLILTIGLSLFLLHSRIMTLLFHPVFAFMVGYVFLIACLWGRFTPSVSSYIWHDDAPMLYAATKQGLDMLRQGGVFGWDSSLLGGFPASFECNYNLSLFGAPFMLLFGDKIGFNIMVFLSIAMFPFLIYMCVRIWLPGNRISAACGIYFACVVLNGYFGDFIGNCSFNRVWGIDFYILSLIFLGAFLKSSPFAGFFLAGSLAMTCAAHLSYFVLSIFTTIIVIVLSGHKCKSLLKLVLLLAIVSMCVSPFVGELLVYRSYFGEDIDHFIPLNKEVTITSVSIALMRAVSDALFHPPETWFGLMPIFLWMLIRSSNRMLRVLVAAYVFTAVIIYSGMQFTDQSFLRMLNGMAVPPVIFLSALGGMAGDANSFFRRVVWGGILFFVIATFSLNGFAFKSWTTPRLKDIGSYSEDFKRRIGDLKGNLILFEGQGGYNHATESKLGRRSEKWSDDVHLVGVFALETGKDLFSTGIDGFHPSVFRANAITSGTYKGKFLSEYPVEEISALLKKWGIKYLVVWSNEARSYFGHQAHSYKRIWNIDTRELQRAGFEPVQWEIYEFLDADPRSVVVASGSGEIETGDYFTKILRMYGVERGAKVIIRTNYFPAWKAFWEKHEVNLFNEDGQLALRCPADGDLVIYLHFPKYKFLTMAAILSLLMCFFLSRRGYV